MIAQDLVLYIYNIYHTVDEKEKKDLKRIYDDALALIKIIATDPSSTPSIIERVKIALNKLGRKTVEPVSENMKKIYAKIQEITKLTEQLSEAEAKLDERMAHPEQSAALIKARENLDRLTAEQNAAVEERNKASQAIGNQFIKFGPGAHMAAAAGKFSSQAVERVGDVYSGVAAAAADTAAAMQAVIAGPHAARPMKSTRQAREAQQKRIAKRKLDEKKRLATKRRRRGAQGGSRRRKKLSRKQRNKRKTIRRKVVKKSVRKKSLRKTKKRKTKRMRR